MGAGTGHGRRQAGPGLPATPPTWLGHQPRRQPPTPRAGRRSALTRRPAAAPNRGVVDPLRRAPTPAPSAGSAWPAPPAVLGSAAPDAGGSGADRRSEEHTSELQSRENL